MKKGILFIFLCFNVILVKGERISGITDEKENALPYVNIGVLGGEIGTVSDINGKFNSNLKISKVSPSLRFIALDITKEK